MTSSTPPPQGLGEQMQNLITRAVEGRILPDEISALRAMAESLTNDRREPVTERELWILLRLFLPTGSVSPEETTQAVQALLGSTVITKLPHPVWSQLQT